MEFISSPEMLRRGERVSLYGAGGAGAEFLGRIRQSGRGIEVACIVDTYKSGELDGVPVLTLDEFARTRDLAAEAIVITSTHWEQIGHELTQRGARNIRIFFDRKRFPLCQTICDRELGQDKMAILDIGAYGATADRRFLPFGEGNIRCVGFEADAEECVVLNQRTRENGLDFTYVPLALWSKAGRQTLYYPKGNPGASSLYPVNMEVFRRWRIASQWSSVIEAEHLGEIATFELPVASLDEWRAGNAPQRFDFAKLNIQGAELEVLRGGTTVLPDLLGVLVEVSFVESYVGRPFFADIDTFLRAQGFTFFDFPDRCHVGRAGSPLMVTRLGHYPWSQGQFIEGHALYLRDPLARGPQNAAPPKLVNVLKLAAIAEANNQVEYAFELLHWAGERLQADGQGQEAEACRRVVAEGLRAYEELFG